MQTRAISASIPAVCARVCARGIDYHCSVRARVQEGGRGGENEREGGREGGVINPA